jgi:hypothetical protein
LKDLLTNIALLDAQVLVDNLQAVEAFHSAQLITQSL